MLKNYSLLSEQILGALKGLIELLAETPYDRLPQSLVYGHARTSAALDGRRAYMPAMVVEAIGPVRETYHTYRIEMARYRFDETAAPVAVSLLDGTKRYAVLGDRVGALGTADKRCCQLSLLVRNGISLLLHGTTPLTGHIW